MVCAESKAESPAVQLPLDTGILIDFPSSCGLVVMPVPHNVTYDSGYAWQFDGVVPPEFGAFAECVELDSLVTVCDVVLDLSQTGAETNEVCDVFIWSDSGSIPGTVIAVRVGFQIGPIAVWPSVSRHHVPLDTCMEGRAWVGYVGSWPGAEAPYYVAADLDSGTGCPRTNVAPGLSYPSGWVNVSVVWQETAALGIGVEIDFSACEPSPTHRSSWGAIKSLYR
jgi:hypothetical protein